MGDKSKIEWTDATWNPIVGCSIVSPGCTNCYAMAMAERLANISVAHEASNGGDPGPLYYYQGLTEEKRPGPVWTGKVAMASEAKLAEPLRWKRPRKIFVNSMGDLFHEAIPDEWIDRVFAVMALAPQHTFQILTKRAARMREYIVGQKFSIPILGAKPLERIHLEASGHMEGDGGFMDDLKKAGNVYSLYLNVPWPLPNVWLGVTAEDQPRADQRIYDLLKTPAAKRFLSCEPLLGPLSLIDRDPIKLSTGVDAIPKYRFYVSLLKGWGAPGYELPGLDWVIAGGESGPKARPMHPDWARSLRDQCADAGVPYFFKQWGEWTPEFDCGALPCVTGWKGERHIFDPDGKSARYMIRVGKRRAGSLLDSHEHKEFPA